MPTTLVEVNTHWLELVWEHASIGAGVTSSLFVKVRTNELVCCGFLINRWKCPNAHMEGGREEGGREGRRKECLVQSYFCHVVFLFLIIFSPNWHFHPCVTGNCWTLRNTSTLRIRVTARYEGGVASYECVSNNYTLIGPSTRQCLRNGYWNGTVPSCISKPVRIKMW